MDVRLVVEQGKMRKTFILSGASAVIGRAKGTTVRIPSAEVSREHCRLRIKDGLVTVEDLNSVNGTFLNGAPISGQQVVGPGDRLVVGPVTFIVEYEITASALDRLRGQVEEVGEVGNLQADLDLLAGLQEGASTTEEPLEVELVEEEEPSQPKRDAELEAAAQDEINLDLSFSDEPWDMPAGGDLRDLLAQMDDEPTSEKGKAKPKKKKAQPPESEG
jgi:pSer/pThr/pTyr-binding forkhead associated (FHA) protein